MSDGHVRRGEAPGRGLVAVQAGDVLLEHRVEVRASEAERTDAAAACAVGVGRPVPELGC